MFNNYQAKEVKKLLDQTIKLYNINSEMTDYIYIEEKISNEKKDLLFKQEQNNIIKLN